MKKDKFHKEVGTVLNYCEIKIDKGTKKVTYSHHAYSVVVSDENKYCVQNKYGTLQLLDKMKSKYSFDTCVNAVRTYEFKWHSTYFDDYLISSCVSTFSEKVTKNRVKKDLIKFINKEAYFYSGLDLLIEKSLSEKISNEI